MHQLLKRTFAVVLCMTMLLSMMPLAAFSAEEEPTATADETASATEIASGACGEALNWSLTEDGILNISGSGAMYAYANATETPWYSYRAQITTVVIGSGVTDIGYGTLAGCPNLSDIQVEAENDYYVTDESGVLYSKDMTTLIQAPSTIADSYDVPNTVTEIAYCGFYDCDSLPEVIMPASLEKVGNDVFTDCNGLEDVKFTGEEPYIRTYAFRNTVTTAYYPLEYSVTYGNRNYGGKLTWVPYGELSGTCGENATWLLSDDGVLTVSGTGDMMDYEYANYPWDGCADEITSVIIEDGITSVGNGMFEWCGNITSVSIADSVRRIGDDAFRSCEKLESVDLGEGVTTIGESAFLWSYALTKVVLPDSVTTIGDGAFSGSGLTDIMIPTGVISIGLEAFGNCKDLKSIAVAEDNPAYSNDEYGVLFNKDKTVLVCMPGAFSGAYEIPNSVVTIGDYACATGMTKVSIPDSVTEIGAGAFNGCDLTEITLPDSVTEIGTYAFARCGLTEITLPGSIEIMGSEVFQFCDNLRTVIIEDGVTELGIDAFSYCSQLQNVTLPSTLNAISIGAFEYCRKLTSITIPDSVMEIQLNAFEYCTKLESVTIPEGVAAISPDAFSNCTSLTGFWVDEGNAWYSNDEYGVLYNKSKTQLICLPGALSGEYTVAEGTEIINSKGFANCRNLTSVDLSTNVTKLDTYAFFNCKNLSSVVFSESLASIETYAFYVCDNVKEIVFTGNAPAIESDAFYYVEATVYYPANNDTWTEDVMQDYGGTLTWKAFGSETVEGTVEGTCGDSVAWTLDEDGNLNVYATTAEPAAEAQEVVVINTETEAISLYASGRNTVLYSSGDGYAMDDYDSANDTPWAKYSASIKTVSIADGITNIGSNAFSGCSNLESVTVGSTVSTIGEGAFANCEEVTVTFTGDEPEVSDTAFEGSTTSVTYPANNTTWTESESGNNYGDTSTVAAETTDAEDPCGNDHKWEECVVFKPATCVATGQERQTCSVCGLYNTKTIAKFAHDPSDEGMVTRPTCTAQGYTTYHCTVCNSDYVTNYVAAVGHAYGEVVTAPTETSQGYTTYTCSNCGDCYKDSYVDPIVHDSHSWDEGTVTQKATCTEDGQIVYSCTECGKEKHNKIAATGHSFGTWTVNKPATCTEVGEEIRNCACGETEIREVTALGHDYESVVTNPTEMEQGYTTHTCKRCGNSYVDSYTDTLGHEHDWDEGVITKAAACTEAGERTYTCGTCGETRVEIIEALGHSYNAVVTEPTCIEQGYTTHTCSVCGDSYVDSYVEATGHHYADGNCTECGAKDPDYKEDTEDSQPEETVRPSWGSWLDKFFGNWWGNNDEDKEDKHVHSYTYEVTKKPTCTEKGVKTYTCECGKSYTEPIAATGHNYVDGICTDCGEAQAIKPTWNWGSIFDWFWPFK